MNDVRAFIGWSGDDNHKAAFKVKELLEEAGYDAIVGGEWKESFTICEDIFKQIGQCNYGIFFIEKEDRYKEGTEELFSRGFNPNVMMELGYMLHKLGAGNIIRVLVDLNPNEMPSDLLGTWTHCVEKQKYTGEKEREVSLAKLAQNVADDFFEHIEKVKSVTSKLTYLDNWWKNAVNIYEYDKAESGISKALIYGLQAAIYSNDYERLYGKLKEIRGKISPDKGNDKFNDYYAVSLAADICKLFKITKRLRKAPSGGDYEDLTTKLEYAYESHINDENLRAWCEILRKDKLAILNEKYASSLSDKEDKLLYYNTALEYNKTIVGLIDEQVERDHDEDYALLYRGFVFRNISNIHKALMELEPDKSQEHYECYVQNCKTSLEYRKALYNIHNAKNPDTVSYDFSFQEYILALAEAIHFETDPKQKRKDINTVKSKFEKWKGEIKARNSIFEKVKKEVEALSNT